jgi:hypothetical protein
MHAIGDKRGSERVAGITLIVEAVEGEDERTRAVN